MNNLTRHMYRKLVGDCFPQVDFRLMFKSHSFIGNNFSFKEKVAQEMRLKIVYRIDCDTRLWTSKKFYIGKTKRHYITRKNEHMTCNNSSVFKHIEENPSHVIDWDNMKILDTAKDKWPLLLKEMLHIKKFKTRTKCTKELKIIKHVNWKQIW